MNTTLECSHYRLIKKIKVFEQTNDTDRKKIGNILQLYHIPVISSIILDYTILISKKDTFKFIIPSLTQDIETIFDLFIVSIASNNTELFTLIAISYFYRQFNDRMKLTITQFIKMYQLKNKWTDTYTYQFLQLPPPYTHPRHLINKYELINFN
jgi:hypothetical protein